MVAPTIKNVVLSIDQLKMLINHPDMNNMQREIFETEVNIWEERIAFITVEIKNMKDLISNIDTDNKESFDKALITIEDISKELCSTTFQKHYFWNHQEELHTLRKISAAVAALYNDEANEKDNEFRLKTLTYVSNLITDLNKLRSYK